MTGGRVFYHRRRPRWLLRMWLWTVATGVGIGALFAVGWHAMPMLIEYESARLGFAVLMVLTIVAYGRINAWMIWPMAWQRGYDEGVYEGCQEGIAAYRRYDDDAATTEMPRWWHQ